MNNFYETLIEPIFDPTTDNLSKIILISLLILLIIAIILICLAIYYGILDHKLNKKLNNMANNSIPKTKLNAENIREKFEIEESMSSSPITSVNPSTGMPVITNVITSDSEKVSVLVISYKTPFGIKTFKTKLYLIDDSKGPTEVYVPVKNLSEYENSEILDGEPVYIKYDYNIDEFQLY